jgi:hypothetical protein
MPGAALDVDLAIGPADAAEVSGTVVVHRGAAVAERFAPPVLRETRFDVWSCTKSLTALAFGMLLADARDGRTTRPFDLETPVYELLGVRRRGDAVVTGPESLLRPRLLGQCRRRALAGRARGRVRALGLPLQRLHGGAVARARGRTGRERPGAVREGRPRGAGAARARR